MITTLTKSMKNLRLRKNYPNQLLMKLRPRLKLRKANNLYSRSKRS